MEYENEKPTNYKTASLSFKKTQRAFVLGVVFVVLVAIYIFIFYNKTSLNNLDQNRNNQQKIDDALSRETANSANPTPAEMKKITEATIKLKSDTPTTEEKKKISEALKNL